MSANNELVDDNPYVGDGDALSKKKIQIVDLFAGIGGFHYGVAASAKTIGYGVKPLLVSEIEPTCQYTYRDNHKCEVLGDIKKIPLKDFSGTADIVTAGFPCQPFSNSGLKLGLSDERGQFYSKIKDVIKHFDAKSFILENVSGIRTNGGRERYESLFSNAPKELIGKTLHTLEGKIKKDLGDYAVKWIEIDSSRLGSPQVRKRIYIVGVRKDFAKDFNFDFKKYEKKSFISIADDRFLSGFELSENQEKNLFSTMMSREPSYHDGMRRVGQAYTCKGGNVGQGYHAYGMVPTLTKVWARFMPIYFPHEKEHLPDVNEPQFETNAYYGKGNFRRVSVREAMLLQGFPKSFISHESDRIAYEHAGNAVNAKVVREITDNVLALITKKSA
jgi:DNA (cytosine-5)-methyltransferase 1